MRPLTPTELEALFAKLAKYIQASIRLLLKDSAVRLHNNRVYLLKNELLSHSVSAAKLQSIGMLLGKFTHSGKFKLSVTCLPLLEQYATYKIWLKPQAEMSFLYGNHILKAHLQKITQDTLMHQGVLVLNMQNVPLGFGTTSKSGLEIRGLDPTQICCFHQADVGEYLRDQDTLI